MQAAIVDDSEDVSAILIEQGNRLFERHCTVTKLADADDGLWLSDIWNAVEENGFTLALVPEDRGGTGLSASAAAMLIRRAGYYSCPVPLGETMLANAVWTAAGGEPQMGCLTIAQGKALSVVSSSAGHRLSGVLRKVPWSREASGILVSVQMADGVPALALLDGGREPLKREANLAGEARDTVTLDNVAVGADRLQRSPILLKEIGAFVRVQQMVGAIDRSVESAIDYARDRRQFGRSLSQFQAIQHMLAWAAVHRAAATAAADFAAAAYGSASFGFAVAVAKARVGEAAGKVVSIVHQVHGAMGFTREHGLHRSTRRLWAWRDEFGNDAFWQEKLGDAALAAGGDALWPNLVATQERAKAALKELGNG